MKTPHSSAEHLENVLQGLEEITLDASDKEILADSNARSDSQIATTAFSKQLSAHGFSKAKPIREATAKSNKPMSRHVSALKSLDERIAYLKELIAIEPRVPPRTVSALHGKKRPTDKDVDKVIEDLIRLGLIKSDKK